MLVSDVDGVLDVIRSFYKNLYSNANKKDMNELQQFIEKLDVPMVSNNFSCSQQVTENDVLDAIKKLNPGKSPGPDGFSPDFYLKFGPFLADLLVRMFNEIFQRGALTYSVAQAIIVLFFKKGSEFDLANYRPISLMNFDYKILAYIITQKIELTFSNCIHPT